MDIAYKRIKELRIKNNLTQEELAKKCGYSGRSAINRIETGLVDIPQSKIEALAKALNTTPAYLMGWENLEKVAKEKVEEERLLNLYNSLNEEGKEKAIEFMEMLDASGKYKNMIRIEWWRKKHK